MSAHLQRYIPLEVLAEGGMGRVELTARIDGEFERLYALKRLKPEVRKDERVQRMFVEEATIAGKIRHPNVVSVLDVGADSEGAFLVMDLVEGICAQDLLVWAARSGVLLPVQLVLRIISEVAAGLHAAHELRDTEGKSLGVVHRDVSPQNVLIGFDGLARIADFGVAKALDRASQTTTGILKGKAGYMSPEQLRFQEIDRRSDIFALGTLTFELLSSRRLYNAEGLAAAARKIMEEPPPDIDDVREDVPPNIVALLFEMLAKEPTARPPTCAEVGRRIQKSLAELVESEGVLDVASYLSAHFADEAERVRKRSASGLFAARQIRAKALNSRRLRWVALGAAAIVVASATGAFLGFRDLEDERRGSREVPRLLAEPETAQFPSPSPSPSRSAQSPSNLQPLARENPTASVVDGTESPSEPDLVTESPNTALADGTADRPDPARSQTVNARTGPRTRPAEPSSSMASSMASAMDRLFGWDP